MEDREQVPRQAVREVGPENEKKRRAG